MRFGKMRISHGVALVLVFLSAIVRGEWSISYLEASEGERAGDMRVYFRPDGEEQFATFGAVMAELKKRGEVQRLRSISLRILNDDEWNARLVEELRKRQPNVLEQAADRDPSAGWGNPDINVLRGELKGAVFALKPFQKVEGELNEFGLGVERVSTEKFWIDQKDGKLRVLGMGLWVRVGPLSFGMDAREDGRRVGLHVERLFKDNDEWVGEFRIYPPKEEALRIYGRWSAKHKMYEVAKSRQAWLVKDTWKAEAEPEVGKDEVSFRLARGTSHKVRVSLGRTDRANAVVRIRGPRFSAFSGEFVLSERSEEFMEGE